MHIKRAALYLIDLMKRQGQGAKQEDHWLLAN